MSYASTTPAEAAPAATDSVGRSTSARYNETLSSRTMCAYGFFRLPISGYDLTVRPARTAVYIEALNQSILTHAMIVSCCKSVDFLLGFLVGTTSDNVSTRWGRRKPWVVICFPFAIVSMFLLVTPFPFSGDAIEPDSATACPALEQCLVEMIANGTLPAHNVSSVESSNPPAPAALSVWFALFYFAYYFFSWTCTMIPYDALGMELTSDYSKRVSLFSVRVVFQFLGYAVPNAVGLVLSNIFPTNIIAVYAYTALVLGATTLAGLLLLAGMKMEDWASLYFTLVLVILFASLLGTPLVWYLTRRFGKREVLMYVSGACCPFFFAFFFVPPQSFPTAVIYVAGVFVGLLTVVMFVVLDSMLADIIDYDALHTGKRSEGVYTVAETNLQQFIEVIGGVVPLLLMSAVGFENNGGCECGCGVACDEAYMRWKCPGDIGYSCDGQSTFDSPPLFGEVGRQAPCSDAVVWIIRAFLFALSGVCLLLVCLGAKIYPITKAAHSAILDATESLAAGGEATDPLTGKAVVRSAASHAQLRREAHPPSRRDMGRLLLWLGAFIAILAGMAASGGEARQYIVAIGAICLLRPLCTLCGAQRAICCSALFVLVPWDAARLQVLLKMSRAERAVGPSAEEKDNSARS
ncbi:hypothetical protein EMIHUDRAFT_117464 [Emiliania huxleyi CCMP1516]|uniref:Uncharacterized protein n=2 Tax=Emiliania huxleyi TaxID=2903 RepID=A0A0D3JBA7_EMIH1|nr:hypothetical protein EMIHUDRAFT_117464 [Emiliania huxleyi CCMP1516]EOD20792.1 hypothetical protein EMIHUDRAFT_117464 [Emiliania huxleyi CCMP1516]|eukprot:XP_005773221.1 hypothetical protein EMIHUDRAFT_117464 [Emiliania huxleyi CCMP1516]